MLKVGDLVKWTGENDEDYGCLGVVSKEIGERFWVTWTDGEVIDYVYDNSHSLYVVKVCK